MAHNVSRHLTRAARATPEKTAVILASGKSISFQQLEAECDRMAHHFYRAGIRRGMRVALFVKPGLEFVPAVFGCFRVGAVPVFIDPGMKFKNILACIRKARPAAVIGVWPALLLARLFRKTFSTAKLLVRVPSVTPGEHLHYKHYPETTEPGDTAAILFTSGSTGVPKGVVYPHAAFDHQQRLLRSTYAIGENEVDLVVFPLFALFSAAWGVTAVIPKMNPARPAKTSGKHLAKLIRLYGVSHTAGSPAIWKNLSDYCAGRSVALPSLNRILMAGAQVPEKLVTRCRDLARTVHTPYGATEALPLTTISDEELAAAYPLTRKGAGTCVGKPLEGVDIAILPFADEPLVWRESLRQPAYQKGEIAVRAEWVTQSYFGDEAATAKAKIGNGESWWHRMGDVGYLDAEGALWFCGRKDHRIFSENGTVYPDPLEAIFEGQPGVPKCAVVGVGKIGQQKPVLVVQRSASPSLKADLLRLAKQTPVASHIEQIYFEKSFPLDVRHNIKIDRIALARRLSE